MKTVIGFICGTIGTIMMGFIFIVGMMVGANAEQKKQTETNFKNSYSSWKEKKTE